MRSLSNQKLYKIFTTGTGYKYYLPRSRFPNTINRFDMEPGHRWDGVDRSNGYERRWFERENSKKDD
jgi:pre-mRNA-splicing factor CWC26